LQATDTQKDGKSSKELEREKYEQIWNVEIYSKTSPAFHKFFDEVKSVINPGDKVVEFGCGTGYGLAEIAKTHEVLGIDIANNCLSANVPFKQACIWEPMTDRGDVGFCVDVMEHIPTDKIEQTFKEIMECVPRCLFIPCLLDDRLGHKHIGEALHLTIKPAEWWLAVAAQFGTVEHLYSNIRATHFILHR
jgi:SAM-dependent methyltransferase